MSKLIIALSFLAFLSCKKETQTVAATQELEIQFKKEGDLTLLNNNVAIKQLQIEIADTEYEEQIGLMNRSKMDEDKGMLFLMPDNKIQTFWMKNTRIPLDIMYVGADSVVVSIAKNAQPYQETGVPASTAPAKFVFEVNGGMSDKWGVKEGQTKLRWKAIK